MGVAPACASPMPPEEGNSQAWRDVKSHRALTYPPCVTGDLGSWLRMPWASFSSAHPQESWLR